MDLTDPAGNPPRGANSFSWGFWVEALTVLALITGLYGFVPYNLGYDSQAQTVFSLIYRFWTNPGTTDWHHGMMVPLISIGLVLHQWKDLKKLPLRSSRAGLAALVASLVLYWIGYKIDIQVVGFLSLQLMIGGGLLMLVGWPIFRALLFPFAFLIFAFPLPFLDNLLAFPLRGLMCQLSQGFLNLVGVDTLRVGTALVSAPDYAKGLAQGQRFALDVATPCSGIRSLFALMMVSALYAHLTLRKTWQKWVLFLLSPALAVAGNFGRMMMLTFGTMFLGSAVAIGTEEHPTTFHMAAGFFVFVVALAGMAGIGWILQRGEKAKKTAVPTEPGK
jgi:exosortase